MHDDDLRPNPSGTPELVYSESLRVPWWRWAILIIAVAGSSAIAVVSDAQWWFWVALVTLTALVAWLFWTMGQDEVRVESNGQGAGTLRAGAAKLPFDAISRCAVVPATAKQAAMGRQLDPAAYVVHKGYIPTMVIVVLDDPADPTPYWLVSTRDPEALVAALPDNEYC